MKRQFLGRGLFFFLILVTAQISQARGYCSSILSFTQVAEFRDWDYITAAKDSIENKIPTLSVFVKRVSFLVSQDPIHGHSVTISSLKIHHLTQELRGLWEKDFSQIQRDNPNMSQAHRALMDVLYARSLKFVQRFEEVASNIDQDAGNSWVSARQAKLFNEYRVQYWAWLSEVLVQLKVPELAHPYEPLEREIDVVFNGGRAWGEVKSISRVLDVNDFGFDRIIRQLKAQSEYRDRLNQTLPRERQINDIHIFLMNGVTSRARRVFERIGVIVHAPKRG